MAKRETFMFRRQYHRDKHTLLVSPLRISALGRQADICLRRNNKSTYNAAMHFDGA